MVVILRASGGRWGEGLSLGGVVAGWRRAAGGTGGAALAHAPMLWSTPLSRRRPSTAVRPGSRSSRPTIRPRIGRGAMRRRKEVAFAAVSPTPDLVSAAQCGPLGHGGARAVCLTRPSGEDACLPSHGAAREVPADHSPALSARRHKRLWDKDHTGAAFPLGHPLAGPPRCEGAKQPVVGGVGQARLVSTGRTTLGSARAEGWGSL